MCCQCNIDTKMHPSKCRSSSQRDMSEVLFTKNPPLDVRKINTQTFCARHSCNSVFRNYKTIETKALSSNYAIVNMYHPLIRNIMKKNYIRLTNFRKSLSHSGPFFSNVYSWVVVLYSRDNYSHNFRILDNKYERKLRRNLHYFPSHGCQSVVMPLKNTLPSWNSSAKR